jgi:hypothetical protein
MTHAKTLELVIGELGKRKLSLAMFGIEYDKLPSTSAVNRQKEVDCYWKDMSVEILSAVRQHYKECLSVQEIENIILKSGEHWKYNLLGKTEITKTLALAISSKVGER